MSKLLEYLLSNLMDLPLPDGAKDEDLSDCISDLVKLDRYYINKAKSNMSGKITNITSMKNLDALQIRLASVAEISIHDEEVYIASMNYLLSLKTIAKVLISLNKQ